MGVAFLAAVGLASAIAGTQNLSWAAPLGASALLLFFVPASPLVRPWCVLAGNTLCAVIGCLLQGILPAGPASVVLAGAVAAAAMVVLRCLHPPGGAVAVATVLQGTASAKLAWFAAIAPVAVGSAALVLMTLVLRRVAGRHYPSHPPPPVLPPAAMAMHAGAEVTLADISLALDALDQPLDVDAQDVWDLLQSARREALRRHMGGAGALCRHAGSPPLPLLDEDRSRLEASALPDHGARVNAIH